MLNYTILRNLLNCSLVLIPIVAFFHNFNTQTFLFASTLPDTINLESIFCRNPQSYSKSDLIRCSSTRQLFLTLKDDCVRKRRVNTSKQEISFNETIELEVSVSENSVVIESEVKSTSFVEILVVILLLVSAVISLLELYRERMRRRNQTGAGGGTPGDGKTCDRRMSLVDLTVSRHTRKRESQQFENFRTNNNTTSARAPPPLVRRMSFPAQLPDTPRGRHKAPMRQQSWCASPNHTTSNRKMSVDLSEDDSSPDRRRVRIIRRH